MVSKMLPPKRMTLKINMNLLTSLRSRDDGRCNKCLPISLAIYLLVIHIDLITSNEFDLFIQASFYYHVIVVAIF